MLGFPSMKNSRLSHAKTGLRIPINPCISGVIPCSWPGVRFHFEQTALWFSWKTTLTHSFLASPTHYLATRPCLDGIVLTWLKLKKCKKKKKKKKKKKWLNSEVLIKTTFFTSTCCVESSSYNNKKKKKKNLLITNIHRNTTFLTSSCSSWPVPRYNEAITTRLFAVLIRAWSEKTHKQTQQWIIVRAYVGVWPLVTNVWYQEMINCKQRVHFLPVIPTEQKQPDKRNQCVIR